MTLPSDAETERLVLGAVLIEPDSYHDVAAAIEPDDFSLEKHRRIWAAIEALVQDGEPVDRVTVYTQLKRVGQAESVDGLAYLTSLDDGLPQIFNLDAYLRELRRLGQCRMAIRQLTATAEEISLNRSAESLSRAEQVLRALADDSSRRIEVRNFADFLGDYPGGIEEFVRPSRKRGLPLPWPSINRWYGGLQPGKLVIVAARTSVGKSLAGVQIGHFAAVMGGGTGVFSLEMSAEQNWARILTQRTSAGRGAAPKTWRDSMEELSRLPLFMCERTKATVPAIRAAVQRLSRTREIKLVVVDYLQLMSSTGRSSNRQEAVAEVSRGLKIAAQETGMCWLVLAQLNRQADDDSEPKLSFLRESGAIEQDADDVFFLHMTEADRRVVREQNRLEPSARQPVPIKVVVAKQRDGEVGARTMRWNPQALTIDDVEGGWE